MAEANAPSTGKRAFLVLGPEASGNRWVTECFVAAGCYGQFGHAQMLDQSFEYATDKIVWRRSLPYGPNWPDLDTMLRRLRENGYHDVRVLALLRTQAVTVKAQIRDHGKSAEQAERNMASAMRKIASFVLENSIRVHYVTYESMENPEILRGVFREWGLDDSKVPAFKDGNQKYFTP